MKLLAQQTFRCIPLVLVVSSIFCNDTQGQDVAAVPSLEIQQASSELFKVGWEDGSRSWVLETSFDLRQWAHVDADAYEHVSLSEFGYRQSGLNDSGFFRLRNVGQSNVYVVGDSVSERYLWPDDLEWLTGRHIFSQAIGGSGSPSMVNRAKGVELLYPLKESDSILPGNITVRWKRHGADRMNDSIYRNYWALNAKTVSEPYNIEVYNHGRLIGFAERVLKQFSTDYINAPKTLFCDAHGLQEGEQVVFISQDPDYPSDLSVTDTFAQWSFSSPRLPSSVVERRVYYAANITPDSFEIRERPTSSTTMLLGSDAQSDVVVELGWIYEWDYSGDEWDLTWKARTKYDDWIWLLEVSANDIPDSSATDVTIPNIEELLQQLIELDQRFLVICPPSGSYSSRGPGSFNWNNYYDTFMPYIRANFPECHIDTMLLLGQHRTTQELDLLPDPFIPHLLWIKGDPNDPNTWEAFEIEQSGATQKWVGPGYVPLQYRKSFSDGIHLNSAGNSLLASTIAEAISGKAW